MKKQNVITSADDMTAHFLNQVTLNENYNNYYYKYSINEDYGIGSIERYSINNNIELFITDVALFEREKIAYHMPKNSFELSCCIYGSCYTYLESSHLPLHINAGNSYLFASKNCSGQIT